MARAHEEHLIALYDKISQLQKHLERLPNDRLNNRIKLISEYFTAQMAQTYTENVQAAIDAAQLEIDAG